jgi:hypothetical protein
MTMTIAGSSSRTNELLVDLYYLVEALDRRVPRLDRPSEARIVQDAVDLRERAIQLIRQLEGDGRTSA